MSNPPLNSPPNVLPPFDRVKPEPPRGPPDEGLARHPPGPKNPPDNNSAPHRGSL